MIRMHGQKVDLERATSAHGEAGGRIETWAPVEMQVEVWVQPAAARTIEMYAQKNIHVDHRVYLVADLGVQVGDRIKWGTRYMKVEGVRDTASMGRLWVLDCGETH